MKIKKLHIEYFGTLSDFSWSFQEGCNIICQENGWGKTTLSVFIRCMFYGFPSKGERAKDREKYRPWSEGIYGGSLTFSEGDDLYTINRVFGRTKTGRGDSFQLLDLKTGQESSRWSAEIGRELFGISEEAFVNTAWIHQDDLRVAANSEVTSRLGQDAELLDDVKRYDEVMEKLDSRLNHLSPTRKTGLIRKKTLEKLELENRIRQVASLDSTISMLETKKREEKEHLEGLGKTRKEMEEKQRLYSEYQDYLSREALYLTLQSEYLIRDGAWEELQLQFPNGLPSEKKREAWILERAGIQKREEEAAAQAEKPVINRNRDPLLMILGLLSFAGGAAGLVSGHLSGLLFLLIGAALLVMGIIGRPAPTDRMDPGAREREEQQHRLLLAQRELQEAETAWRELKRAETALRDFLRDNPLYEEGKSPQVPEEVRSVASMKELNDAMTEIMDDIRETENRIQNCVKQIEQRLEERSDLTRMEEKASLLGEEIATYEREYFLAERTRELLAKAKDTFSAKYLDSIRGAFRSYYRMIDEKEKEELYLDTDYEIHVMGGGMLRSVDVLSRGYRSLAGLCLRFALLDAMYEKERPFVILDDPFVNFDSEKYQKARGLLEEVSERYQTICFVSRES